MAEVENQRPSVPPLRKSQQPLRNPRLRLACARCQRRKIRCDGKFPACNNCKKASAVCTDGESLRLRGLPREDSNISNLRKRITWLESIVRAQLPGVDLSQGPPQDADGGTDEDEFQPDESMTDVDSSRQQEALSAPLATGDNLPLPVSTTTAQAPLQTQSSPRLNDLGNLPGGPPVSSSSTLSHEIGLVSVGTNQDPKYIGPSSGYFLARLLLKSSQRRDGQRNHVEPSSLTFPFPSELVEAVQGPLPMPSRDHSKQLCDIYFEVINIRYPILHQPSFIKMLAQLYENDSPDPLAAFQVYMVLAIGATILSRRLKARIPGESYCLSALQYFNHLNVENSLPGLQCLLLLLIFTMHSPSMRLNVWYLNYQCIAALLDLGLQRDITTSSGISLLEQEMRTRIFWVVFTLDRTIATMMGRPIGLRDEACELRLPQNIEDSGLSTLGTAHLPASNATTRMSFSIHLFKLAKLNSEIKYVANSIIRDAPRYAYPVITDIHEWHRGMLQQLDQWVNDIPQIDNGDNYIHHVCQLQYHSLRMLLLRPSPAIPNPSAESLRKCHESSHQTILLFDQLYRKNLLVHSWMTIHSLTLGTITMLYCIRAVPDIARKTELDVLMSDLGISLSILSAMGEHWSGAKRSRDILDDLARATIRWIKDTSKPHNQLMNTVQLHHEEGQEEPVSVSTTTLTGGDSTVTPNMSGEYALSFANPLASAPMSQGGMNTPYLMKDPLEELWGSSLAEQFEMGNSFNVDSVMRSLFEDFIPNYPTVP